MKICPIRSKSKLFKGEKVNVGLMKRPEVTWISQSQQTTRKQGMKGIAGL